MLKVYVFFTIFIVQMVFVPGVVVEDDDGVSKGYGFVRFMDERERDLCLVEMAGAMGLGRKPLTIKPALAPKSRSATHSQ